MNEAKELVVEVKEGIAVLALNRPKVHNAISMNMRRLLGQALEELNLNDDVRVLILTGVGKSFCAGVDLKERKGMSEREVLKLREKGPVNQMKIINLFKPVIAAINGNALAGGLELALACDIRIASETAVFGLPEISLGIIPGGGGTQLLPRLIGDAQAREMILTGGRIDAQKAERMGLVSRVVVPEELMNVAVDIASKIKNFSPIALKNAKKALNLSREVGLTEGFVFEAQAYLACIHTKDRIEALQAFTEKRKPIFRGE